MSVSKALTIAGTDPSGGAGIQADLKTFQELEVYGMSVITSVVSQNTMGVKHFTDMSAELIETQIDAVFEDIRPDAVKTGMLSRSEIIQLVVRKIKEHQMINVVVDPVMVAKSGDPLLAEEAKQSLIEQLLPVCDVVTPNIPEAEAIVGRKIESKEERKEAARRIVDEYGAKAAIVKGGHVEGEAVDTLYDGTGFEEFSSPRFDTKHTHGTGCTFSSAIAAELAKGADLLDAIQTAKTFIYEAISHPIALGKGRGPVNHWAYQAGVNSQVAND
jgi:hydroxymethylpyrimidine/phosphomethylpyrimidine kinase